LEVLPALLQRLTPRILDAGARWVTVLGGGGQRRNALSVLKFTTIDVPSK
jgi:hypothetical protein